jgi:hypothetical protein
MGLKVAISTEAHSIGDLRFMRFGVSQARRGWLGSEDVLNTAGSKELLKRLKKRKRKKKEKCSMFAVYRPMLSLIAGILILLSSSDALSQAVIEVGKFSAATVGDKLPSGWKPLSFKKIEKQTSYTLVKDEGKVVVKAVARASASGLIREIEINPKEYPIVQWRWKVTNILKKGNVKQKDGDDYPARIYITFKYDPGKLSLAEKAKYEAVRVLYGQYPPHGALNYI